MGEQNIQAPSCETVTLTVGSTGMGRLKERGAEFSSVLAGHTICLQDRIQYRGMLLAVTHMEPMGPAIIDAKTRVQIRGTDDPILLSCKRCGGIQEEISKTCQKCGADIFILDLDKEYKKEETQSLLPKPGPGGNKKKLPLYMALAGLFLVIVITAVYFLFIKKSEAKIRKDITRDLQTIILVLEQYRTDNVIYPYGDLDWVMTALTAGEYLKKPIKVSQDQPIRIQWVGAHYILSTYGQDQTWNTPDDIRMDYEGNPLPPADAQEADRLESMNEFNNVSSLTPAVAERFLRLCIKKVREKDSVFIEGITMDNFRPLKDGKLKKHIQKVGDRFWDKEFSFYHRLSEDEYNSLYFEFQSVYQKNIQGMQAMILPYQSITAVMASIPGHVILLGKKLYWSPPGWSRD